MTEQKPTRAPRVSTDVAARLTRVRETMAELRDNHIVWIIDAAIEYFAKRVEETEIDIVRYERLPELPIYTAYGRSQEGGVPTTRADAIQRERARLEQYHAILEFLDALKNAESLRSAEAFATAVHDGGLFDTIMGRRRQ